MKQLKKYLDILKESINNIKKLKRQLKICCQTSKQKVIIAEIAYNKWIIKNVINELILWNNKKV